MDTPTKPPQRRLRVVDYEGAHFGEDLILLRWRAEDGTKAERIFAPSVWYVMPAYAERGYQAAMAAHPVTHFDVARTGPPTPAPAAATPAPGATDLSLTPDAQPSGRRPTKA